MAASRSSGRANPAKNSRDSSIFFPLFARMGCATQAKKAARPSSVMENVFLRRLPAAVSRDATFPLFSSLESAVCTLPALCEQISARFFRMNCCTS